MSIRLCPFHRQQHGASPLAADADTLDEAEQRQQHGAPDADLLVGWHEGDEKVASAAVAPDSAPLSFKALSAAGAESSILEGDAGSESYLHELPGRPARTPAKAGSGMGIGLRSVPLYIYRDQWRPKTRFCLFLTIFYVIAMLFLILAYLYPENRLVRTANIFPIFWANFVFICFIFLLVAWCVYGILDFCYTALMRSKWFKPKLGEVLLDEGFVTEQELEEALAEQQMKLGEILLQQGSITQAQLKETLEEQSRAYKRLGVILRERGYVTDKDIQRALAQSSRRLGQILEEKGFVRGYELHLGLGRQRFGIRTLRWD